MRVTVLTAFLLATVLACGSSGGGTSDPGSILDTGGSIDPGTTPEDAPDAAIADVPSTDVAVEDVPAVDVPSTDVAVEDVPPTDVPADVPAEDIAPEADDVAYVPDFANIEVVYPARSLAFAFERAAEGEPIPAADVTDFSKKVAAAWKSIGYFRWLLRTSTGVDATTGKADYLAWHNDLKAVKAGDSVTFVHQGHEHNMWIPGSVVLSTVANGYLLTGDWEMAKLTEQYCKGLTAVIKGFIWDEQDPAPWLMARSIMPMDHAFTLDEATWKDDGRKKAVEFSSQYFAEEGWNAKTFEFPHNPTWGSLWITNMRSKDDVRSITRTTTFLPYVVADAKDEWVRAACDETMTAMKNFQKDIVDSGYNIRTKDKDGNAYVIPCSDQDLGSYVCYYDLDPRNECCQRLSADLIAYGERKTNDCGTGFGSVYDGFASAAHYYNIPIVWDYHMAALGLALQHGRLDDAWFLMQGLAQRIDSYMHPTADEPGHKNASWNRDMALLLVQSASMGLPLTAAEARHVEKHFAKAAELFSAWTGWDLWTLADGDHPVRPSNSNEGVEVEAFAVLLEYCNSPFKNPAGAAFVDCDVLKDPSAW